MPPACFSGSVLKAGNARALVRRIGAASPKISLFQNPLIVQIAGHHIAASVPFRKRSFPSTISVM